MGSGLEEAGIQFAVLEAVDNPARGAGGAELLAMPSVSKVGMSPVTPLVWFEVWWDPGLDGRFFLVLQACSDGTFKILNPQSDNHVEGTFARYEDAYDWLREEEYELLEGRVEVSEP